MLVTKDVLAAGSTRWAQGGIAAALGAEDTPDEHFHDTIMAGAGLCDEAAVARSSGKARRRCASSRRWARVSTARRRRYVADPRRRPPPRPHRPRRR